MTKPRRPAEEVLLLKAKLGLEFTDLPIISWSAKQGDSKRLLKEYIRNRASWSPSKETSASPSKGQSSPAARHLPALQSGQKDET